LCAAEARTAQEHTASQSVDTRYRAPFFSDERSLPMPRFPPGEQSIGGSGLTRRGLARQLLPWTEREIGGTEMGELRLACCGLDCKECPVFAATVNDDHELRRKTAEEWGELYSEYIGKKELSLEDMNCHGCQSDSDLRFIGCENCPIRGCCRGRNLATCADCDEYEACAMIHGFFTSAPQAEENLDRVRANRQV
jgi:hypothetical protein